MNLKKIVFDFIAALAAVNLFAFEKHMHQAADGVMLFSCSDNIYEFEATFNLAVEMGHPKETDSYSQTFEYYMEALPYTLEHYYGIDSILDIESRLMDKNQFTKFIYDKKNIKEVYENDRGLLEEEYHKDEKLCFELYGESLSYDRLVKRIKELSKLLPKDSAARWYILRYVGREVDEWGRDYDVENFFFYHIKSGKVFVVPQNNGHLEM